MLQYGVKLVRGIVKEVKPSEITLSDGTRVPYGLLVWSTGVGPSEFVKSLVPTAAVRYHVNRCGTQTRRSTPEPQQ